MTDSMGWTISSHIHTLSFEDEHIPARKSSPMILIGECEPNTIPDQNENGDEAPSSSDEANCLEVNFF
jgi:hypothetical protein